MDDGDPDRPGAGKSGDPIHLEVYDEDGYEACTATYDFTTVLFKDLEGLGDILFVPASVDRTKGA